MKNKKFYIPLMIVAAVAILAAIAIKPGLRMQKTALLPGAPMPIPHPLEGEKKVHFLPRRPLGGQGN